MKTTNIEIRKITFNNFEFKVNESEEIERDGKATISMDLPDREANQNNQIILINMNVDYKDSRYSILAEIDSVYSVSVHDLPQDISKDVKFQQALINPMVEKLRLYIGLFSDGAYGAIQIPNLHFSND
jgi:hypothetical protein